MPWQCVEECKSSAYKQKVGGCHSGLLMSSFSAVILSINPLCPGQVLNQKPLDDLQVRVDLDGHRLIQTLVEQLAKVQENAWVFSVASELVQVRFLTRPTCALCCAASCKSRPLPISGCTALKDTCAINSCLREGAACSPKRFVDLKVGLPLVLMRPRRAVA